MSDIRFDWTIEEIEQIYNSPLLDLVFRAASIHRKYHTGSEVQVCSLLSIKTGGCPEDCSYCPQAARYQTGVKVHKLLDVDEVLTKASIAHQNGSTRFCMGAAWRNVRNNRDFDKVIEMVKGVKTLGMEVCCTLGMITDEQAK
ncbi:MAG: biotin synthase, partial [Bacteroidota bacterium]